MTAKTKAQLQAVWTTGFEIGVGAGLADPLDLLDSVLLGDGTNGLSADWDAGSYKITAEQFESDIATGTAPLVVASSTMVANLNADLVDGIEGAALLKVDGSTTGATSQQQVFTEGVQSNDLLVVASDVVSINYTAGTDPTALLQLDMEATTQYEGAGIVFGSRYSATNKTANAMIKAVRLYGTSTGAGAGAGSLVFHTTANAAGSILTDRGRIDYNGDWAIGTSSAAARLHVDQDSATGAKPVLYLDQADVSEELIEIASTAGVGNAVEAVGAKTLTTTHFLKVTINGATRYIPAGTIA